MHRVYLQHSDSGHPETSRRGHEKGSCSHLLLVPICRAERRKHLSWLAPGDNEFVVVAHFQEDIIAIGFHFSLLLEGVRGWLWPQSRLLWFDNLNHVEDGDTNIGLRRQQLWPHPQDKPNRSYGYGLLLRATRHWGRSLALFGSTSCQGQSWNLGPLSWP